MSSDQKSEAEYSLLTVEDNGGSAAKSMAKAAPVEASQSVPTAATPPAQSSQAVNDSTPLLSAASKPIAAKSAAATSSSSSKPSSVASSLSSGPSKLSEFASDVLKGEPVSFLHDKKMASRPQLIAGAPENDFDKNYLREDVSTLSVGSLSPDSSMFSRSLVHNSGLIRRASSDPSSSLLRSSASTSINVDDGGRVPSVRRFGSAGNEYDEPESSSVNGGGGHMDLFTTPDHRPATVHHSWEFPGWGKTLRMDYSGLGQKELSEEERAEKESHLLGEWMATSICGNDITSSAFYCVGLVAAQGGIWAPVCMALVSLTLYVFRSIYGEAVTALPLNGGAYNILLNTTSKMTASIAACLTILSYVATGVVSAASAVAYLQNLWQEVPVYVFVVGLLGFFALLSLMGMTESATAAFTIFVLHILTLTVLVGTAWVHVARNGIQPAIDLWQLPSKPALGRALFYGFASAMLGVTGFETSANFVEEQKEGVFVLTLRNMWTICAFFNPSLSLLCVLVLDYQSLLDHPDDSLALLGKVAGGPWLQYWVSADAFLVLAGSVLTAYVGFTGLCRRLALDRCLPEFMLAENSCRKTNHFIILGFFGLCVSLYSILNGDVTTLSNVYTVSFLGVMALFALGNMILKYKRNDLPRSVRASWIGVITGFSLVAYAFAGTISLNPSILGVWLLYFSGTGLIVGSMFFRVYALKFLHYFLRRMLSLFGASTDDHDHEWLSSIASTIQSIKRQPIAFFAKRPLPSLLNKAILYIRQNEDCAWVRIIHCHVSDAHLEDFQQIVKFLDQMYPKIKIDLVCAQGAFSPDIVANLSEELGIPRNLMFMACPKSGFSHKISELGGVRLITSV